MVFVSKIRIKIRMELLDRDHMIGDFATFNVGENSFVLRLEELDVALRDYEDTIAFFTR